jgi:hypothetical protein
MSSVAIDVTPCRFGEIYLHTDSESLDLHNRFDFVGFTYDSTACTVRLRWRASEQASDGRRRSLLVEMRGVTHLSATPRDPEMPFSEDTCLSAVGGIAPSDPTTDGVYSDVPPGWHHVFTFMSRFVLRVGADSVCLLPNDI